jgi:hypothetical protein
MMGETYRIMLCIGHQQEEEDGRRVKRRKWREIIKDRAVKMKKNEGLGGGGDDTKTRTASGPCVN